MFFQIFIHLTLTTSLQFLQRFALVWAHLLTIEIRLLLIGDDRLFL